MVGDKTCDKNFEKNFKINYFNKEKKKKDFKSVLQVGNKFFK